MAKTKDAFRTISEVAEWLDVAPHVLRYWESKFAAVKPVKRAGGRRYYRPADMRVLGGVRKLLHDDGMTIKGVQKMMSESGANAISEHSRPLPFEQDEAVAAPRASTLTSPHTTTPSPAEAHQEIEPAAERTNDFRMEDTPAGLQASLFLDEPIDEPAGPNDAADTLQQVEPKPAASAEAPAALDVPVIDEPATPEADVVSFPAAAPFDAQTPAGPAKAQITPVQTPADPTDTELTQRPTIGGLIAQTSPNALPGKAQSIRPLHDRLAALAAKMDAAK
ncbi:MerR family transcriptional regulator [Nereida sp.]|uniref:MerR family transcriptional regulator n=1 Tax=Nereida sp. TaxID=2736090 RepID=UPI003F699D55